MLKYLAQLSKKTVKVMLHGLWHFAVIAGGQTYP